eukprot:CCRYP_010418-RA/>CCRYP_010418-RA protein AED:0.14 eAED:-0.15 QI:0/0/0/1/0/0/2/0/325
MATSSPSLPPCSCSDSGWLQYCFKFTCFCEGLKSQNIPCRFDEWSVDMEEREIAAWIKEQSHIRLQLNTGNYLGGDSDVARSRIMLLESISGFPWVSCRKDKEEEWERNFAALQEFQQQHGHCRVPQCHENLGGVVARQHLAHKNCHLDEEIVRRLDAIGFEWDIKSADEAWDRAFEMLLQFRETHGHCNIPQRSDDMNEAKLGKWVASQRVAYNKGKLPCGRIDKLNSINFIWSVKSEKPDEAWDRNFMMLLQFREIHGHCDVPQRSDNMDDTKLGRWVVSQRVAYKKGKLPYGRIEKLNSVHFKWVMPKPALRTKSIDRDDEK